MKRVQSVYFISKYYIVTFIFLTQITKDYTITWCGLRNINHLTQVVFKDVISIRSSLTVKFTSDIGHKFDGNIIYSKSNCQKWLRILNSKL